MSLVLVVDDDPVSIQLLELMLSRNGFDVLVARGGASGLDMVHKHQPDLVIIDDMMPGMSGGEMCRRMKTNPHFYNIPVILISAGVRIQDDDYIREVGADYALSKPALTRDVLQAVEFALARS